MTIFIVVGNDATSKGSWVHDFDGRRLVTRSPKTYPIFLGMLAFLFAVAALLPILSLFYESSESLKDPLGYYISVGILSSFCGGVVYFVLSMEIAHHLEIDIVQRTYHDKGRGWFGPREKEGTLNEIDGIYCSPRGSILLMTRTRPATTCGTLGQFGNRAAAMPDAEWLSSTLRIPLLDQTWRAFP
jgi:hypothetical protein